MRYKNIALLTDFGLKDNFVGVMKGVIYKINPNVNIIDITHEIESHNIFEAYLILKNSYKFFPEKTIFVSVVDPTVGTNRKIIIIKNNKQIFIAPDNGILSFLPNSLKIFQVKIPNKYIESPVSNTFHGRDIFAKLAGLLSKGVNIKKLCSEIKKIEKIKIPEIKIKKNLMEGEIIYIDKFGNCFSNIEKKLFYNFIQNRNYIIKVKNLKIDKIFKNYQINKKYGALFNSFELLEIFVPNRNASKFLKIKKGDKVKILKL